MEERYESGLEVQRSTSEQLHSSTSDLEPAKLSSRFPADSLFAILELPLEATLEQINQALSKCLDYWHGQSDHPEFEHMIDLLDDWDLKLRADPTVLEKERERCKQADINPLPGTNARSVKELLDVCEKSRENWEIVENLLCEGALEEWVRSILKAPDFANIAAEYRRIAVECQNRGASCFYVLNELFYRIVPERPFRFYHAQAWEPLENVPDVPFTIDRQSSLKHLVALCDADWATGESHLYDGSMICWLQNLPNMGGIGRYYETEIRPYFKDDDDKRGVGLELLLEHILPDLTKPKIEVTFDDTIHQTTGRYELKNWDVEIAHQDVSVTFTNVTRGFTYLEVSLQPTTEWKASPWRIYALIHSPVISGTPGQGMPTSMLMSLGRPLQRGHTYQCALRMSQCSERGKLVVVQEYPVVLNTLPFYRGLSGILWCWGLRGNIPGLVFNFAGGYLLTWLLSWSVVQLVTTNNLTRPITQLASFGGTLQQMAVGTAMILQLAGPYFPLAIGLVAGFYGCVAGLGSGHSDETTSGNALVLARVGCVISPLLVIVLVIWLCSGASFAQQSPIYVLNVQEHAYGSDLVSQLNLLGLGSILVGILAYAVMLIIVAMRFVMECFLQERYAALLNPPGRR